MSVVVHAKENAGGRRAGCRNVYACWGGGGRGLEHSGRRRSQEFESHSATCDCAPANSQLAPHITESTSC